MFPHDYFAAGAFAPDYFPPTTTPVIPPVPPVVSGGGRGRRRPMIDRLPDEPFPSDDEFWIWFT